MAKVKRKIKLSSGVKLSTKKAASVRPPTDVAPTFKIKVKKKK